MKAWVQGETVNHDDLNGNFNQLLAMIAALSGGVVVTSHTLLRDGISRIALRDASILSFR